MTRHNTGNEQNLNVVRPYNTRSGQVPNPPSRNTRIPPVRGQRTSRYARTERNYKSRNKSLTLQAMYKDETDFYRRRIRHMSEWLQKFTCKGVTLVDLRKRSVSGDKRRAEQKFAAMVESCILPRKTSGIWVDDSPEAEWLVIYAGEHVGETGKTYRDGFTAEEIQHMMEVTQAHFNALGVKPPAHIAADQRHAESALYAFLDYDILGGEDDQDDMSQCYIDPINDPDATESVGLRHDVQCWHEQGGIHRAPVPSVDLRGNGSAADARAATSYVVATAPQQKYLDMMLKAYAPQEYEQLKKSAMAGRWIKDSEEGCTLGLATIWKLQVGVHLDHKDWELCMIVCGGNFTGGALYLPDLDLCLAYLPGDIVIFRSPYLFHAIGQWKPGPMLPHHTCTPGRVSWVHFTHSDVHEKLKDKPAGYFRLNGQFNEAETLI